MKFLTLSEREIKTQAIYQNIRQKHIVISITGSDSKNVELLSTQFRLGELHLKFDDITVLDNRYIYFDRDMATQAINFLNSYCSEVDLVIVHCHAGISRSVGLAAALSKIVNFTDDDVFTKGIPNMFVYTTTLDTFFLDANRRTKWSRIYYRRTQAQNQFLTPAAIKLEMTKDRKESQKQEGDK